MSPDRVEESDQVRDASELNEFTLQHTPATVLSLADTLLSSLRYIQNGTQINQNLILEKKNISDKKTFRRIDNIKYATKPT